MNLFVRGNYHVVSEVFAYVSYVYVFVGGLPYEFNLSKTQIVI